MRWKCQTVSGVRAGFTIIELCIVIAILAAVVGVVVVGGQMLENATLQRTAAQVRDMQTAVAGFRARYNAWPGDFRTASLYWSGAVNGDGDNRVTGGYVSGSVPPSTTSFECYNAWHHLALSGFYNGSWSGATTSNPSVADGKAQSAAIDGLFISMRHDESDFAFGRPGHYLAITRLPLCLSRAAYNGATTSPLQASRNSPWWRDWGFGIAAAHAALPPPPKGTASAAFNEIGLLPAHAAALDTKLDDGLPLSGSVISALPADRNATRSCVDPDGANVYNILGNRPVCGLWSGLE